MDSSISNLKVFFFWTKSSESYLLQDLNINYVKFRHTCYIAYLYIYINIYTYLSVYLYEMQDFPFIERDISIGLWFCI